MDGRWGMGDEQHNGKCFRCNGWIYRNQLDFSHHCNFENYICSWFSSCESHCLVKYLPFLHRDAHFHSNRFVRMIRYGFERTPMCVMWQILIHTVAFNSGLPDAIRCVIDEASAILNIFVVHKCVNFGTHGSMPQSDWPPFASRVIASPAIQQRTFVPGRRSRKNDEQGEKRIRFVLSS